MRLPVPLLLSAAYITGSGLSDGDVPASVSSRTVAAAAAASVPPLLLLLLLLLIVVSSGGPRDDDAASSLLVAACLLQVTSHQPKCQLPMCPSDGPVHVWGGWRVVDE